MRNPTLEMKHAAAPVLARMVAAGKPAAQLLHQRQAATALEVEMRNMLQGAVETPTVHS